MSYFSHSLSRSSCLASKLATMFAASVAFATAALASDVQFSLSPRETWVGSPSRLTIQVTDALGDVPDPVLPSSSECNLTLATGRNTQTSMQFINGAISSSSSVTLTVLVTPLVAGRVEVPPVTIKVDGKEYSSGRLTLLAGKSEAGDRLQVSIETHKPSVYLGEEIEATLRIAIRPFADKALAVRLDEGDMWGLIDQTQTEWGSFAASMRELTQQAKRPVGREEVVGNSVYFVYEIPLSITPTKVGIPEFGGVRIAMKYPTALTQQRDFFGSRQLAISAAQPISITPQATTITVLEPPMEGRPANWNGAVGSFRVAAQAKPTKVAVGDPITVTYVIQSTDGPGALQSLQPPEFARAPGMQRAFRVPSDPIAGAVSGDTKVFTQTLRPTTADAKEIPAIPYSWFDPTTGLYEGGSSEPIAITVSPSETLATSVVLGGTGGGARAKPSLTAAQGGLLASVPVTESLLKDDQPVGMLGLAIALGLAPAGFAAVALFVRRRDAHQADAGLARDRGALREARRTIAQGQPADALLEYIGSRTGRPVGTLTRADAARVLRDHHASPELILQVDELLGETDQRRFAPTAPAACGESAKPRPESPASASDCLRQLDQIQWRRATVAQEWEGGR